MELIVGVEAARQLMHEHGQQLDHALEQARRCPVELSVEQHR
jgi:hypothetical protein